MRLAGSSWLTGTRAMVLALVLGGIPALAQAQDDDDNNYRGWGPGWGMMGGHYGMGPGMMGGFGYGMGPGMMGGGYGYDMGPGMMGNGFGMGPGMMGGFGYGPGPGMMGGGYGMGPGMMGGFGPLAMLDLTDQQRTKIREIQTEHRKQQWEIAGKMLDEQAQLNEAYASDTPDPKQVGVIYGRIAKLQQQQAEAHVSAWNRMQSVLTKEQREQLAQWRRGFAGRGFGYGPRNPPGPGGMMRR